MKPPGPGPWLDLLFRGTRLEFGRRSVHAEGETEGPEEKTRVAFRLVFYSPEANETYSVSLVIAGAGMSERFRDAECVGVDVVPLH